jgi:hypothetical protein
MKAQQLRYFSSNVFVLYFESKDNRALPNNGCRCVSILHCRSLIFKQRLNNECPKPFVRSCSWRISWKSGTSGSSDLSSLFQQYELAVGKFETKQKKG